MCISWSTVAICTITAFALYIIMGKSKNSTND